METKYIIQTSLEVIAVIAITVMILNEEKMIVFEEKLKNIIIKKFKSFKLK